MDLKIYGEVDKKTIEQAMGISSSRVFEEATIRIMPDAHYGKDVCIGFTAKYPSEPEQIIPSVIGVDIGCGVAGVPIPNIDEEDLPRIDEFIKKNIPTRVREHISTDIERLSSDGFVDRVKRVCKKMGIEYDYQLKSLGTLGGGNHFIEIGLIEENNKNILQVHSGSRNFGLQVEKYHTRKLKDLKKSGRRLLEDEKMAIVNKMKEQGKHREIPETIKHLSENKVIGLRGEAKKEYLEDCLVAQEFARVNRELILHTIAQGLRGYCSDDFQVIDTVHNYYDKENHTIRKGAISAKEGERVLIPISSKYGTLCCVGKGNKEWNDSAPHGAGRVMSRTQARKEISLDDYEKSMETAGIFTTSANIDTLDECYLAYRNPDSLIPYIDDSCVKIEYIIKPIYSMKG